MAHVWLLDTVELEVLNQNVDLGPIVAHHVHASDQLQLAFWEVVELPEILKPALLFSLVGLQCLFFIFFLFRGFRLGLLDGILNDTSWLFLLDTDPRELLVRNLGLAGGAT